MKKQLLLVEDERQLLEVVKLNLELEGHEVSTAESGDEALALFRSRRFDLLLLDVMLPRMDGFALCRTIRLENRTVPILFLTAKNSAQDRVMGLRIGGDDYLVKPFDLNELLLRVKRLLERSHPDVFLQRQVFAFGGNVVYFDRHEALTFRGQTVALSVKEVKLLMLLADRLNQVVARAEMLDLVWGTHTESTTRAIDNYIVQFRKHFEPNPSQPIHFLSHRGVGYRLAVQAAH